jgi:starch synthase
MQGTGTGFKFEGLSPDALLATIDRSLSAFEDKNSWRQLMRNDMAKVYDWQQPAREYADVYEEVSRRRG